MREPFDKAKYRAYLLTDEWKRKRLLVLDRDSFTCVSCGKVGGVLNAHHTTYDRIFNELLDDLVTLCIDCHGSLHKGRRYRKGQSLVSLKKPVNSRRFYFKGDKGNGHDIMDGETGAKLFTTYSKSRAHGLCVQANRTGVPPKAGKKDKKPGAGNCRTCGCKFNPKDFPKGGGWYCSRGCRLSAKANSVR